MLWVEQNWHIIERSVENPIKGDRWWTQAEDPWQFLAAALELRRILHSPNPSEFLSGLTIHQDGSCNGLQHYAALGRDFEGGRSVNLTPSSKPQDVYSRVLGFVNRRVEADAANGDPLAMLIRGKINRKTIKQTVMTSVYGVTLIGSRDQIRRQLEMRDDIDFGVPKEEQHRVWHLMFVLYCHP